MYQSTLNFLVLTSFLLTSAASLVEAKNTRHNPNDIFQNHYGRIAINVKKATGAETLHKMGFEGQGKTVAIIDFDFLPKDILNIQNKGLLHPLALKEKTAALIDNMPYKRGNHGRDVMNTLRLIVPKAQILPIDVKYRKYINRGFSHELVEAVRTAIRAKVNVINLSIHNCNVDTSYINVLKEAIKKGIAIISCSGNYSSINKPFYLDKLKNIENGRIVQVNEKIAFDQMGRKGVLFAGALNLTRDGHEIYAPFSSHPTPDTESHFVTTIGANVPVPDGFFGGTSAAAPLTAGSYLLAMQYAESLKQSLPVETFFKDLHDSGHDITHNTPETPIKTYKVLDIKNAIQRIFARAKAAVTAIVAPKPAPAKTTPLKGPTVATRKIVPIKTWAVTARSSAVKTAPLQKSLAAKTRLFQRLGLQRLPLKKPLSAKPAPKIITAAKKITQTRSTTNKLFQRLGLQRLPLKKPLSAKPAPKIITTAKKITQTRSTTNKLIFKKLQATNNKSARFSTRLRKFRNLVFRK